MDDAIGRIIAALEESGQRSNTLILFTSDNGGSGPWTPSGGYTGEYIACPVLGNNRPLRGLKGTVYDGGIRVPALVNWPGRLKPATVRQPIHIVDWMPTLCSLVGFQPAHDLCWDGIDVWPSIDGRSPQTVDRTLYWRTSEQAAIRASDWKLVVNENDGTSELFDLANDPYEENDLASQHPEKLSQLKDLIAEQSVRDERQELPFNPDVPATN
jgi:arylsulfatase A-like enzyme